MINIRTLKKITNNGGLTLKDGKPITYKSGWQVATEGIETTDMVEAMKAIKAYGGNCGIWFADGVWYIDLSHRVNTKREALEIGRACNQISVLRWRDMGLAYCQTFCFGWRATGHEVSSRATISLYYMSRLLSSIFFCANYTKIILIFCAKFYLTSVGRCVIL